VSVYTIEAGGVVQLDPSDRRVLQFNWDNEDVLASGVEISSSTWTITPIRQADENADLTKDNESLVAGNRKTQVRLIATTASDGDRYEVANTIVTNEVPAQTIEQSFRVVVQNQ
jgi:hypothetical protein